MDKKVIQRSDWVANFNLVGEARINEDYTFKIDERSERSNWIYNSMNLGIDCGERNGTIYCEMMGGYGEDRENRIFAHGKKDDGSDDFDKQIIVDWEDRFNDSVLEEIGDLSFITVGLEKTDKDKTFYKKFLSEYDAIAYVREHITDGTVVNVRGNLKYSLYNDVTQVRKTITSIALSKAEDSSKYKATFTQSVLLDKDSVSLKDIDKEKSVMYVNAKVLDFLKEYNGVKLVNAKGEEKGGQFPFAKQFEFALDLENEKQCKTIYEKLFKVKKGVTQITFEGEFIEGGAVVTATWEDIPDDIKALVEMGLYDKEEALAKCTVNGNRERRMVLKKPSIKLVEEDKIPVVQKFDEKYSEEDLVLDYLYDFTDVKDDEEVPFATEDDASTDDLDWLNKL